MKLSVKKTLGTIGVLWLHALATIAVLKGSSVVESILWPLVILDGAMFGLKVATGWVAAKQNANNGQG